MSSPGLRLGLANKGTAYWSHDSNMPVCSEDPRVAVPPLAGSGPGLGMAESGAAQDANWWCGEDWWEGCERAAGDITVHAKRLKV